MTFLSNGICHAIKSMGNKEKDDVLDLQKLIIGHRIRITRLPSPSRLLKTRITSLTNILSSIDSIAKALDNGEIGIHYFEALDVSKNRLLDTPCPPPSTLDSSCIVKIELASVITSIAIILHSADSFHIQLCTTCFPKNLH